jgi:hypothetical protein
MILALPPEVPHATWPPPHDAGDRAHGDAPVTDPASLLNCWPSASLESNSEYRPLYGPPVILGQLTVASAPPLGSTSVHAAEP